MGGVDLKWWFATGLALLSLAPFLSDEVKLLLGLLGGSIIVVSAVAGLVRILARPSASTALAADASKTDTARVKSDTPDMTIWQAVHYLATRSQWSYEPRGQSEPHALLDQSFRACTITAWGRRCLTPIPDIREADGSGELSSIQSSDHEERIPCSHWAHMAVMPRWIGYAEFAQDEYASARNPHLTGPRGANWLHCYAHLRVNSDEIKRVWPPRWSAAAPPHQPAHRELENRPIIVELRQIIPPSAAPDDFQAGAYVQFSLRGTVDLEESYNVTSVSDEGLNQFRINFATSFE